MQSKMSVCVSVRGKIVHWEVLKKTIIYSELFFKYRTDISPECHWSNVLKIQSFQVLGSFNYGSQYKDMLSWTLTTINVKEWNNCTLKLACQ